MLDVPSLIFLTMFLSGLAALTWMMLAKRRRRRAARERLEEFKANVVAFSDRLDQMQERHKMLPFLDPDYTAPMTGETQRAYQQVQDAIHNQRERWLKMMDVWDQVQRQLEQGALDGRDAQSLSKRLEEIPVARAADELQTACGDVLDLLEQAHETARAQAEKLETVRSDCETALADLAKTEVQSSAYQADLDAVADLSKAAANRLEADPLGASQALADALRLASELQTRIQQASSSYRQLRDLREKLDALNGLIAEKRREGYSFAEPEGDPAPLISETQRHIEQVVQELIAGKAELTGPLLESADTTLQRGEHVVRFQEKLRSYCDDELRRLRGAVQATLADIQTAELQREQLRRQFNEASWALAADSPSQARVLVDASSELLDQIDQCVRPDRQYYFRANRLLEEARRALADASNLANALPQRAEQLGQLRDACHGKLAELRRRVERTGQRLRSSTADRPRSNQRYESATRALEQLIAEANAAMVDWPQWSARADHLTHDLEVVQTMIDQDLQLFEQARQELEEAQRSLRAASSYYQHGVRPNLSRAEELLEQARRDYAQQHYEQAIASSNSAEQAARAAREAASEEAVQRQREANRRRRTETAAQVSTVLEIAATAALRALQNQGRYRR